MGLPTASRGYSPKGGGESTAPPHADSVQDAGGRSDVLVVPGKTGNHHQADPDGRANNNLDNLPDC